MLNQIYICDISSSQRIWIFIHVISYIEGAAKMGCYLQLYEIFGCGTACVVSPVGRILYRNKSKGNEYEDMIIPTMEHKPNLMQKLYDSIVDIQVGWIKYFRGFQKKNLLHNWCVFLCNLTKVLKDMEWSCAENPLDLPYCLIWRDMNTTATFTSEEAPKLVTTIRNWPNEQKSVQPAEPSTVNCRQMRASMQTTISAESDHYMWESRHFAMVHICRSFSTFTVRSTHPWANASLQWNYHLKIMKQACFI